MVGMIITCLPLQNVTSFACLLRVTVHIMETKKARDSYTTISMVLTYNSKEGLSLSCRRTGGKTVNDNFEAKN